MSDIGPYSNYRLTVRLELKNRPGAFLRVVSFLARNKANLGGVDIVEITRKSMVRDVSFDAQNQSHGESIIAKLRKMSSVKVRAVSDRIFVHHIGGKIQVQSKVPVNTRNRLAMIYTPGVARVANAIYEDPEKVYNLTIKSNSVAVVSDGSAVLGLGNLGPEAALPVMEGKAVIFREFAGVDAWPICLKSQSVEEIVETVRQIAPAFGAINLEDISAPRCFEIEQRLKDTLKIPVMHDDQHGTAIVVLAALKNALKLTRKDISKTKIVVNGLGAAGIAICRILLAAGARRILGCDKQGVILYGNEKELYRNRRELSKCIHPKKPLMNLRKALTGADVFIGVSQGNILKPADLRRMKAGRVVFAMANPDPEIDPVHGIRLSKIFATGRSDFPNQINNALAFPGIFRGALQIRAKAITEPMKLAAANAIANLIKKDELCPEYIVPSLFDKRVVDRVSEAVAKAAIKSGIARRKTLPKK